MRNDASPWSLDRERSTTVTMYPKTESMDAIISNTATTGFDLAPFITRVSQSAFDAQIAMTWDGTGAFLSNQPKPGYVVVIKDDGVTVFTGFVDDISNFTEGRGSRGIQITCRVRDGIGPWRKRRFTSRRFMQGYGLNSVIADILDQFGLSLLEYDIAHGGAPVPHSNVQFTDTVPWEVITDVGIAQGVSPYTDALGRFKTFSRSVTRVPDISLTTDQVLRITGGKAKPGLTTVRVLWLDRHLTKVVQEDQALATEAITAGFFRLKQERDVHWSEDRRSRADNTYMVVKQSINDGLLPIGDEEYKQTGETSGEITVTTSAWVPGLATASLAAMLILDGFPDFVAALGVGATTPVGRVIRGVSEASLLLIMMSIGTGHYEVRGQPFDHVHNINRTEAYDDSAPAWMEDVEEIENNLIFDEAHAQEVAVRELLHRIAASNRWDAVIADDPRIEIGDIIELPDTSRLYVTDYQRDLSRGAKSELKVSGFRA